MTDHATHDGTVAPDWRAVTVTRLTWAADQVAALTLTPADGTPLPAWDAGAHIDLRLPSGLVRQYSLCGEPADPAYTVAVLREPDGRGGSAEIHDTALLGRTLSVRGPRNHFPLAPAERYVFVAGGIGVTPVLALAREATARGVPWALHYGGRCAASMAFTGELTALAARAGAPLELRTDERDGPLPLARIMRDAAPGSALYACGPAGMLAALRDEAAGREPKLPLRTEQFTAAPVTPAATTPTGEPGALPGGTGGTGGTEETGGTGETIGTSGTTGTSETGGTGGSFEVELARTGRTVTVADGTSILEAVRGAVPDVLSSCEEGFCGTCETKVLDGTPVHRDTILSEEEREKSATMMICVGGCASGRLVLDL